MFFKFIIIVIILYSIMFFAKLFAVTSRILFSTILYQLLLLLTPVNDYLARQIFDRTVECWTSALFKLVWVFKIIVIGICDKVQKKNSEKILDQRVLFVRYRV